MGIAVKMITGDQLAIARETAKQLGMSTDIYTTGARGRAGRRTGTGTGGVARARCSHRRAPQDGKRWRDPIPAEFLEKGIMSPDLMIPAEELVEKADGFAEVFPQHKFEIVRRLQQRHHTVGMTGDGVNDAPALKQSDIGIAVAGATV